MNPSTYLQLVTSFTLRADRPTSTGPWAFMVCKETTLPFLIPSTSFPVQLVLFAFTIWFIKRNAGVQLHFKRNSNPRHATTLTDGTLPTPSANVLRYIHLKRQLTRLDSSANLLGSYAVPTGESLQTFRKSMLPRKGRWIFTSTSRQSCEKLDSGKTLLTSVFSPYSTTKYHCDWKI